MPKMKDQLFVEPTDGELTNNALVDMLGSDNVYIVNMALVGGGFVDVALVTKIQLARLLSAQATKGYRFNVYDRAYDELKLRPIVVAIKSDQLTVVQVLNRRVQKKLVKIRSLRHRRLKIENIGD
jgi:hypothetical protein